MRKDFILSFDLPEKFNTPRVRIFRALKKLDAEMVNESFWKSDKLNDLIEIAKMIKRFNGNARILEEKFVF